MNNIEFTLIFIIFNLAINSFHYQIAKFINVNDLPNERKIHKTKTPLLGGYIILLNIVLFSILILTDLYDLNSIQHVYYSKFQYLVFYCIVVLIFLVGAVDDKINLNPNLKLLISTILVFLMLLLDNSLLITELRFSFLNNTIHLGKYSFIFSALSFLLFINACNMFDGINLQSTSYFITLVLSLIILDIQNLFLIFLLCSLFLIFKLNFRGKIFMGDSGIYIFSSAIAYLIIKNYNYNLNFNADTIFIFMMIPGIDMLRLFLFRIIKKKNPFFPDKNHLHHLLLNKFSYLFTIITINLLIIIPIFLSFFSIPNQYIIISFVTLYILILLHLNKRIKNFHK